MARRTRKVRKPRWEVNTSWLGVSLLITHPFPGAEYALVAKWRPWEPHCLLVQGTPLPAPGEDPYGWRHTIERRPLPRNLWQKWLAKYRDAEAKCQANGDPEMFSWEVHAPGFSRLANAVKRYVRETYGKELNLP